MDVVAGRSVSGSGNEGCRRAANPAHTLPQLTHSPLPHRSLPSRPLAIPVHCPRLGLVPSLALIAHGLCLCHPNDHAWSCLVLLHSHLFLLTPTPTPLAFPQTHTSSRPHSTASTECAGPTPTAPAHGCPSAELWPRPRKFVSGPQTPRQRTARIDGPTRDRRIPCQRIQRR